MFILLTDSTNPEWKIMIRTEQIKAVYREWYRPAGVKKEQTVMYLMDDTMYCVEEMPQEIYRLLMEKDQQ